MQETGRKNKYEDFSKGSVRHTAFARCISVAFAQWLFTERPAFINIKAVFNAVMSKRNNMEKQRGKPGTASISVNRIWERNFSKMRVSLIRLYQVLKKKKKCDISDL